MQKPLVKHQGYFTSGKFDQYQRNIPYSSLIQALRHLLRTFLTESDQQVRQWQVRILAVLGNNGQLLTDVLPELAYIIGNQPDVVQLPPVEARNRFNSVFGRFLTSLACERNPLILFIDDLQWCDVATFDFLHYLFANAEDFPYLYFMGAYRHNEIDVTHPLLNLQQVIIEHLGAINEIRLKELDQACVHEMVAYILDATLSETTSLAEFLTKLTEGNPLFVSESLAYLYNENLLFLDQDHHWRWDIKRIRDSHMPVTVVELFSSKVCKLPRETQLILEHCACMGNRFTAQALAIILDLELTALFEKLMPVLSLGMLLENKLDLQFVHDRVQESVLRMIDVDRRKTIHWHIGNRLYVLVPAVALEKCDDLFTIATHLNQGRPNALASSEVWMLVAINFYAGNKALESLATEAANDFFRSSYNLLPEDAWSQDYAISFRIVQRLAKTELMKGCYDESERLINRLIEFAANDLDKAEALAEHTTWLSSLGNFNKAIATANRGLTYFAKAITMDAQQAQQKMQTMMQQVSEQGDVWQKILHMPFTERRASKIELALYSELIPDLYMSGMVAQLYLSAVQSTLHCLEGGMDESVIYSFSIMGLNLGEQGQFELAFRYQDLAHDLCARYPNTFGATRGMNGIVWCNMHSRSNPAEIVDYCYKAIQCGKNCGDLYNAGLSYGPLMWNLQLQGKDLLAVELAAQECLQFSRKNRLSFSVGMAEAVLAAWVLPMKSDAGLENMQDKLTQWQADNHVASAGSYFVLLGIAQFYLGDYQQAELNLHKVTLYLHGLTDNVLKRQWRVFSLLNQLRLHAQSKPGEKPLELLTSIAEQIEQIRVWSQLGPLLKPYYLLLQAEIALISCERREARNLYFDCLELTHAYHYGLLEAYVHQCLAEMKQRTRFGDPALHYREALRLYEVCNAHQLRNLLLSKHVEYAITQTVNNGDVPVSSYSINTLPDLNLNYLMKSALAISAEIDLEQLLNKIMHVVLEASGAQHGYLLIKDAGILQVSAESHVSEHLERNVTIHINQNHVKTLTELRGLGKKDEICLAIVNFVFRTQEKIILANASEDGAFTDTPEVQALGLRSLMCMPVIKQGLMIGVLYVENRLADGVFTADKIDMTEMLMAQAAISLENANLLSAARQNQQALQHLNETLEQRIAEEVAKNREKDLLMIQQSRLAAMGEMIGNIAHQWRQPLNALGLVLANIQDAYEYNELNAEYIQHSMATGTRLIQKMSTTINDFRDFFKSDKAKINFSARAQIDDAIALVEAAFKNSNIEVFLTPGEDVLLYGFPNEYSQVLLNLLSNAKDAILSHQVQGKVIISLFRQGNLGCVRVEDNGGGIPEVVINKIFDPYFSTKTIGFGIGLYMSKMIIELNMSGRLDVYNTKEGAAFIVSTPLAKELCK